MTVALKKAGDEEGRKEMWKKQRERGEKREKESHDLWHLYDGTILFLVSMQLTESRSWFFVSRGFCEIEQSQLVHSHRPIFFVCFCDLFSSPILLVFCLLLLLRPRWFLVNALAHNAGLPPHLIQSDVYCLLFTLHPFDSCEWSRNNNEEKVTPLTRWPLLIDSVEVVKSVIRKIHSTHRHSQDRAHNTEVITITFSPIYSETFVFIHLASTRNSTLMWVN